MSKTHWKKLTNPDYLGSYALEPGQDIIATIKSVGREMVTGTDGKKEECTVAKFHENIKPMILNATNSKTIQKIYKTPYIEDWAGCKIQVFSTEVKVGRDVVDALRIRPYPPKIQGQEKPVCADCAKDIQPIGERTVEYMARYTANKYGKPLCAECAKKRADKDKENQPTDPLADDKAVEDGDLI